MISIKEKCDGKVWKALQFMIDGLKKQSKRKNFKIDMRTFGGKSGDICFGCAATCSIQELTGRDLIPHRGVETMEFRAEFFEIDEDELNSFENCMDAARMGLLTWLFSFFGKDELYKYAYSHMFTLSTDNWQSELPKVEALIEELKKEDI